MFRKKYKASGRDSQKYDKMKVFINKNVCAYSSVIKFIRSENIHNKLIPISALRAFSLADTINFVVSE